MVNRIVHFFRLAYQGKQWGKKDPATHLVVAIAFLYTPILYAFVATNLNASRGPIQAPEWITIARIISTALAIFCVASLFFIERHIRTKSAEKIRKKGMDPELSVLICGFAFLESPTIMALILFFFGGPVTDVYAYSIFCFIGVAAWSWRQRALFRASVEDTSFTIARSYTIVLIILSGLAFMFLAGDVILLIWPPENYTASSHVHFFSIPFYTFLTAGCWITAFLRSRRYLYAMMATKAITTILLFWFPFGTAAFVYWIKWVRKKESERRSSKA